MWMRKKTIYLIKLINIRLININITLINNNLFLNNSVYTEKQNCCLIATTF